MPTSPTPQSSQQTQLQRQFSNIFSNKLKSGVTFVTLSDLLTEAYGFFAGACEDIYKKTPEMGRPDCALKCDHCCHQFSFQVTAPEICFVVEHLINALNTDELVDLKKRVDGFVTERAALSSDQRGNYKPPCPLLADHSCMVYSVRPFVCQGFNSFDKNACLKKRFEPELDPDIPVHGGQVDLSRGMAGGLRDALITMKRDVTVLDFIAALDIALNNENACAEWLAGGNPFAAAEFNRILNVSD